MKRKIIGFISIMVVMTLTMAASGFATLETTLEGITGKVKTVGIAIVAFSAVVTAIMYMASAVNPGMKENAKKALVALIIGVVILFLSDQIAGFIKELIPGAQ